MWGNDLLDEKVDVYCASSCMFSLISQGMIDVEGQHVLELGCGIGMRGVTACMWRDGSLN